MMGQVVRLLAMRGLYAELAGEPGPPKPVSNYIFGGLPLHLADLPANPMYGIAILQPTLTRRLHERARRLGVQVRWGHRLIDLTRHEDRVVLTIHEPHGDYRLDTRFLVGAGGGKSTVRKRAGIGFPGHTSTGHPAGQRQPARPVPPQRRPRGPRCRTPRLPAQPPRAWHGRLLPARG